MYILIKVKAINPNSNNIDIGEPFKGLMLHPPQIGRSFKLYKENTVRITSNVININKDEFNKNCTIITTEHSIYTLERVL